MSKLAAILEDQLSQAKQRAGESIIKRLPNGLRIEIQVLTSEVSLTLIRHDAFPSLMEWDTVCKHFPYVVPRVQPQTKQEGNRYTISARFPSNSTLQLKFF